MLAVSVSLNKLHGDLGILISQNLELFKHVLFVVEPLDSQLGHVNNKNAKHYQEKNVQNQISNKIGIRRWPRCEKIHISVCFFKRHAHFEFSNKSFA